jgi:4-hydroxybenzoate polyprenyltransferase
MELLTMGILAKTRTTLEMIKWEHSIFALPFALSAAMLAAGGIPAGRHLFWIVVAMVGARSAAMAFNRLADAQLDATNPRTATRALPAGHLSRRFVALFVCVSAAIFMVAAAQLNRLALLLSPVALAVLLGYSYTKRFTRWSHIVLGFALGMAPAAAWIAVRGSLDSRILLLTAAVTLWVGGFDVLYACQDYEHDCRSGLYSIPRFIGIRNALALARAFHVVAVGLFLALVYAFDLGAIAVTGVLIVATLLIYEHRLVSHDDLSKLNAAFFTLNGFVAVLFFVFIAAAVLVRR